MAVMGTVERFRLADRSCACFIPGDSAGRRLPLAVLCGWNLEEQLPALAEELPPMLLFTAGAEGDRDFTPWPVPGLREGERFTGEAGAYLSFLKESALPCLEAEFGGERLPARRALLGYSLGGLFSLWCLGQKANFGAYASLSGSLWYDGFLEYLQEAPLEGTERVYLSLGDREEFGGPPRLRAVGEKTREAAALLEARLPGTVLEWNKGGHGKGVQGRWKKALRWAAEAVRRG